MKMTKKKKKGKKKSKRIIFNSKRKGNTGKSGSKGKNGKGSKGFGVVPVSKRLAKLGCWHGMLLQTRVLTRQFFATVPLFRHSFVPRLLLHSQRPLSPRPFWQLPPTALRCLLRTFHPFRWLPPTSLRRHRQMLRRICPRNHLLTLHRSHLPRHRLYSLPCHLPKLHPRCHPASLVMPPPSLITPLQSQRSKPRSGSDKSRNV